VPCGKDGLANFLEKMKRLLRVRISDEVPGLESEPKLASYVVNTRTGPSKIHIRSLIDGGSMMVVDGHFLVSLNPSSHLIMTMKLEGKTNESIFDALSKRYSAGSRDAIREDIARIAGLLDRLRKEGTRGVAGSFAGNLFACTAALRHPLRADIQLRSAADGTFLTESDGILFLEKLHERGVLSVRFISSNVLAGTPVVRLVGKAQDIGIIAGLMMKGREIIDRSLLLGLLKAGIDYFEMPFFSNIRMEHEQIEGTGGYDADLEGIKMIKSAPDEVFVIAIFPVIRSNIDNIEETLALLKRYGIDVVKIVSVIVPDEIRSEEGLGITLQEYEHAVAAAEISARSIGLSYIFGSPVWYRKHNPRTLSGWGWTCTAAENSPFIATNGDIFPCMHSRRKLGSLKEEEETPGLPSPLRALTNVPPDEVDYTTLCNCCLEL
jgi:hypothetical protein